MLSQGVRCQPYVTFWQFRSTQHEQVWWHRTTIQYMVAFFWLPVQPIRPLWRWWGFNCYFIKILREYYLFLSDVSFPIIYPAGGISVRKSLWWRFKFKHSGFACNDVECFTDFVGHYCKCDLCSRPSKKLKSLITVQITGHCNSSVHN